MVPAIIQDVDARYRTKLRGRLGASAPPALVILGNLDLLAGRKTAIFCSARCPGDVILAAHDQAVRWRDEDRCVIGGFHAPLEKECLRILLRGRQPIILCLARGLEGMRQPAGWKELLADNRLLVLSQFPASERRVTKDLAVRRNQLAAALADDVVFAHIAPGGHLEELSRIVACWRIPQACIGQQNQSLSRPG
jgi:predicted Rossmann fold nucleotide-binding protein DprA/Smf involved in DNA uptake